MATRKQGANIAGKKIVSENFRVCEKNAEDVVEEPGTKLP